MNRGVGHRIATDPVLYEVYVRSFADSNGDGVGDLRGIAAKIPYLASLGIDGVWITPVFESPQLDYGYDVSDYTRIHPEYGNLEDMDQLVATCHANSLALITDAILGHTSNQHPWFTKNREWYIWSDEVPNNWLSVFGGSAWTLDPTRGAYYYHRFYPEQPSLNWSNPQVRDALHSVLQFWLDRGLDGFRLDSFDGIWVDRLLRDEPVAPGLAPNGRGNDPWASYWSLRHIYTCDLPEVHDELSRLSTQFPSAALLVEADLPAAQLQPYLAHADSAFAFDFIRAPLDGSHLGAIIDKAGSYGNLAWAMSNHDQRRLVSRWGRELAHVAAVLLLTLPGWCFIYQGDEIGMVDGHGGDLTHDRAGRDAVRHPMQWTRDGGFTSGVPWLPLIDPELCNVEDQQSDPYSMLNRYRHLIRIRRLLSGAVEVIEAEADFLSYRRGSARVTLNLNAGRRRSFEANGEIYYQTPQATEGRWLSPCSAVIEVM